LAVAQQEAVAGNDELACALFALDAVLQFLGDEPLVQRQNLDRPLAVLARALHDVLTGGRPGTIFARSSGEGGAPKDQSPQVMMGTLAACVDALMKAGMLRKDAGGYVAEEAKKRSLSHWRKHKGVSVEPISPEQILSCRAEMDGGRASNLAQDTYKRRLNSSDQHLLLTGNRETDVREAQKFVRASLDGLCMAGF
jgi:hypothetical protein